VPTQSTTADDHPITAIVKMAQAAKLMVIIDLHGAPSSQNGLDNSGRRSMDTQVENWGDSWLYNETALKDTTSVLVAITKWINGLNTKGVDNIIMLELVNEPWVFGDISRVRDWYFDSITAIRVENATLPLLIHDSFRHSEWTFLLHHWTFTNVFMDTHLYHAFNIEDLASSNPECDKSKQIAHENLGCRYGSLLRYKTCISLPTHIGEFSLAIDNCVPQLQGSTDKANQFLNFGTQLNMHAMPHAWTSIAALALLTAHTQANARTLLHGLETHGGTRTSDLLPCARSRSTRTSWAGPSGPTSLAPPRKRLTSAHRSGASAARSSLAGLTPITRPTSVNISSPTTL
jgi:hypothetical protein